MRGYCLLDRAAAPGVLDQPDATARTAPGVAHTFRIEVDPLGEPDGTPNTAARVRVFADMANTGTFVTLLDAPLPPDPPPTFEFGLAASTGLGTNVHEIRALRLETVSDLPRWTLAKTHAAPLVAGSTGTFTLQAALSPTGGAAYAPVLLEDELPGGLTIAAIPSGEGWDCGATVVGARTSSCTHPASVTDPIRPGTRLAPVTVPVRIASQADGRLVNVARLSGPEILTPIEAPDPFELRRAVDLSITKRANPTRLAAGERTSFTLVVTNHGPGDARRVLVVDRPPRGLTFDAALPSQGSCTRTATLLRCQLGAVRAGASAQIVVDATATIAATGRTLRNVAVVRAPGDEDPTNDTADAAVHVSRPGGPPVPTPPLVPLPPVSPLPDPDPGAQLHVDKRVATTSVQVGAPVDYAIRVHNSGSATAHDVVLTDTATLPATVRTTAPAARACAPDAGVVHCRLGDLAPGAAKTIRARVTYHRPGLALNTASLTPADESLADRIDAAVVRVRVSGRPGGAALRIVKTADRSRVLVGDTIRYCITVRSLGPDPAERVRVCDRLPNALRLVSAEAGRGPRTACWTVARLAPGASRTFMVAAQAIRPDARARNHATARARNAHPVAVERAVAVADRGPRACPAAAPRAGTAC